ncbi:pantetheine-phosphate adenylyltransferase [Treponema sp. OMZ 840]|uniref:pantetheine-phosphate adenylyltransferase n=1 Tax=Treponema sp. OMZ 840 TaxID=244313 RepID=UPI003D90A942
MVKALFPGSFDPPTYGHLNILERARNIFSEIDVVIADNQNKKYLFSEQERLRFMQDLTSAWDNVSVHVCHSLVVDYAHKTGAKVLIRGIRNTADFSYEFDLSLLNRALNAHIETLFFPTDSRFFLLKSSAIKELASFGGDVSDMVPEQVEKALKEKFGAHK